MGADEEGTHERLKAHLEELVNPKIAEHRGRIVKNTGDGFLAEFASVVDGVRCGVEVQRGMVERNAATPVQQRIEFRMGINLGDVIAEGEDIFGDGVNIAARLEALADPGGILTDGSGDAFLHAISVSFSDMRSRRPGLCQAHPATAQARRVHLNVEFQIAINPSRRRRAET
jgi:adenylate cyclase